MNTVIVIPSRYGSSRFPGKPLAEIAGYSMLRRVWEIARAVNNSKGVLIATDDPKIFEHAKAFGAKVVMTSESCRNGTERVYEAVKKIDIKPDIVVNLQGDAVLTPPWIIDEVVKTMIEHPDVQLATPAVQLDWDRYEEILAKKKSGITSGTLVAFDKDYNALYFSKNIIPNIRKPNRESSPPVWLHTGLYGYRFEMLEKYLNLEPTPLETAEQLEQLRALENSLKIRIVPVDYRGRKSWSVDNPEDIEVVEKIIREQGELVELK